VLFLWVSKEREEEGKIIEKHDTTRGGCDGNTRHTHKKREGMGDEALFFSFFFYM